MMRPFLQFYETVNISLIILITDCAPGNSLRIIDHEDITVVLLRKRAFGFAIRALSGSQSDGLAVRIYVRSTLVITNWNL